MIKDVQYFNEVVIGRIAKIEKKDNRINISVVENFDKKEEEPNWINLTAFNNDKIKMADRVEKACKSGTIVTFFVKKKVNGQYTNRTVVDFKVTHWPAKKN